MAKKALTHFKVVSRKDERLVLELVPETGRTHQLRVHCAENGLPIVGDTVYGKPSRDYQMGASRLMLHAHAVSFVHPVTGKELRLIAPLPKEFS